LVRFSNSSKVVIGDDFTNNNGEKFNPIGRQNRCVLVVSGVLEIQDNVGMSSSTIVCRSQIKIGNNVRIGGNVCIYDTDFHAIEYEYRIDEVTDQKYTKNAPIIIGDNVFIGGHSTILKGVNIGANSVIAACSLVSKNIPPNEIWGGNPIRFIKKLTKNEL